MKLNEMAVGESAVVNAVGGEGALRQHLLDMGVIPGTRLQVVKFAPMGDPMEIRVHQYELTLRLEDAGRIDVTPAMDNDELIPKNKKGTSAHPGFGEGGRFHAKGDGNPLPENEKLTFALVGNQNCGKTTLFNQLTGANQHVGNFPGVTVDRKDGALRGYPNTSVTDLPGIYSMSPYTAEEIVSRNFVLENNPRAIINIIDATNMRRNLYLTMQLLEMNIPMVVALNMMDEVSANGGAVEINDMEAMLGVPVVPISAAKNQGVDELIRHAMHVAHFQEKPLEHDFCGDTENGGAVHRCLHAVEHLIEDHARYAGLPLQFAAGKLVEGDHLILEQLALDENEKELLEHIIVQLENERGLDRSAAMADMRFSFINRVCEASVTPPGTSHERVRSEKIDRILTGKFTAIPAFVLIMLSVFLLTFNVIGSWLQKLLDMGINTIGSLVDQALTNAGIHHAVHGLITDGIFKGVGSVVSFLPIVVVLFFFLSILEDSGYIARVAFFMDKLLRKIGLSGRSIVPMLIGFGCTVPAVMATRTLPSERDRKMTILMTPFMSCSAKLPIYAFFSAAFFPKWSGLVMTGLYLLGIFIGIVIAFLYKKTIFRGEAVPFMMELPNYRLPSLKNVGQLMWEKAKDFLQKACSVILVATIVIWFLQSFNGRFYLVKDSSESMMAGIAGFMANVFKPLGLGDWRICTSLISGFIAKESVVSTMEILYTEGISLALSPLTALSLMVFSLLYTPCAAAIASVRREMGRGWAIGVIFWQCFVAWAVTFLVRIIAMAFGMI